MGTTLYQRGTPFGSAFEQLNVERPALVQAIHRQFVVAGAELIETNTFGANAYRLKEHGLEGQALEFNRAGAMLARGVAGSRVFVGGSLGPLGLKRGDDLPGDADSVFATCAEGLALGGVDAIVLETFTRADELLAALGAAGRVAPHLPVLAQIAPLEGDLTADGLSHAEVCRRALGGGAAAFGFNCGKGPRAIVKAMEELVRSGAVTADTLLTAFSNAGFPELRDGRYIYLTTPEYMANAARELAALGVTLIGGCCGTTSKDVAAMKLAVRGRKRPAFAKVRARLEQAAAHLRAATPKPAKARRRPIRLPAAPSADRIDFLTDAAPGRTPPRIIVEIDPPKGCDPTRGLRAARRLAAAGADAITIGDSPLAVSRMSAVDFGHLVQRETGVPVVVHLSCRDRNVIGTRSALLGAHALGVRAVLAVTGDPASVGGQPGASSVYDMNSFGLVELVRSLNEVQTSPSSTGAAGRDATDFRIGVAFNPNGLRMTGQLQRLQKKVERGAQFAQTQPCYDTERVLAMYHETAPLGIPIFLGLLPLYSEKAAHFCHNEIPGIDVPDYVIERLRGLDKEHAHREGLAICLEQVEATLDVAHGYYLIPPFSSAKAGIELLEGVRAIADRKARRDPLEGKFDIVGTT
jgi:homocysteine S-methyltransferase